MWVEGTGIIRAEFAPWIDASIWVQGDLDEQERRLVARDGDSAAQQHHIAGWLAEELPLMLREQPWQKATIVVAGTTELDHDPDAEIVVASPANARAGAGPQAGADRPSQARAAATSACTPIRIVGSMTGA